MYNFAFLINLIFFSLVSDTSRAQNTFRHFAYTFFLKQSLPNCECIFLSISLQGENRLIVQYAIFHGYSLVRISRRNFFFSAAQ